MCLQIQAVHAGAAGGEGGGGEQRPLAAGMVRQLLARLASEGGWPSGWATDGVGSLYMASMVLPQGCCEHQVALDADRSFKV